MKEKESPKDKMPMRPAEARAAKGTPVNKMPAPQQPWDSMSRAPVRADSHMAARGSHVDGMSKWSSMQSETRKPVKARDHNAPPNSATGS